MTDAPRPPGARDASRLAWLIVFAGIALFWALRIAYWVGNEEPPFSDLLAYETMGRSVAAGFEFSGDGDGFWQSYWPPGTGALRGLVIWCFGVDSQLEWQFVVASSTFGSLSLLAREVFLVAGRLWPSALLVLTVSLSRPSVFWSFKVSTEPVTEMLVYAACAACLASRRSRSPRSAFLLGLITAALFLTRGNYAPLAPILLCVASLDRRDGPRRLVARYQLRWRSALAFVFGVALLWGPWLGRNYRLYDAVVPLVTAAPFTFMLEAAEFTVTQPDGRRAHLTHPEWLALVQDAFPNDYEAMRYGWSAAGEWLAENPGTFVRDLGERVRGTLCGNRVALTRLPREPLFCGPGDLLLVERSLLLLLGGMFGLLVAVRRVSRRAWILVAVVAVPWLAALPFVGVPRMVDPSVPLLVWANLGWLVVAVPAVRRRLRERSARRSTGSPV